MVVCGPALPVVSGGWLQEQTRDPHLRDMDVEMAGDDLDRSSLLEWLGQDQHCRQFGS